MATQEITDVDTLIEDDIEDVGELDLEEEEAAAPVRRRPAAAAAAVVDEEEEEPGWVKALMVATFAILVLGMPVVISIGTGTASDIAKTIAGMAGASFEETEEAPAEQ